MRRCALLVLVVASSAAAQQRGVPQNGFPSWGERTLLVLVNRSRAEPTAETNTCTAPVVRPPLQWDYASNRAARFHSTEMQKSAQEMHNSPCVLASNLSSTYLPGTTCDGAVACACSTGVITCNEGTTCAAGTYSSPSQRMQLFGVNTGTRWGENIFYAWGGLNPGQPSQAHTWWLNSTGHCDNTNGDFTHLGTGHYGVTVSGTPYHYWTEGFTKTTAPTGTLIAGSHDPQFSGSSVTFLVNYYDTAAPQAARLNVDGTCTAMTRQRGSDTNGTWALTQTLSGTTCRRYRFSFVDPRGVTVNLPQTGSYGVGGSLATCPDWSATEPTPCPGATNSAPSIMTAASATPNPVTATTTALSVLAADDGGEAALTYTWASTSGPAPVSFSVNATNGAKATTATFTRAGSYTLAVTARDVPGLATTSTVTVVVQATPTTISVTPATASVAPLGTVTFSAAVTDQFGQVATPALAWSVSGGGSLAGGVFTAGTTPGGPHTVTATAGAASGTAQVTITAGSPPILSAAASATPAPVTGTTTTLSVLATDDGGEAALSYTWTAVSGPATVAFSVNGTNAAKTSTATFTRAGSYTFSVAVRDALGLTATSTVMLEVQATPTALTLTPAAATIAPSGTVTFVATVRDQFGQPTSPSLTWAVSGGGSISGGVFTAGAAPGGPFDVTAAAGSVMGMAQVTITAGSAPSITAAATASPAPVTGTTTSLAVLATDDGGEGALTYTWSSASGPAAVTFSVNGTNAAKTTTATFTQAGSYTFGVTARDAQGLTGSSSVVVEVLATPTMLMVTPPTAAVAPLGSVTFMGSVRDQFGLVASPALSWTVSGGGSMSSGVFTAGVTPGGPFDVTATAGSVIGTAQVTVTQGSAPTISAAATATPSPVTSTSTSLSVLADDDGGEASLVYTWAATSGPAGVAFSRNAENAAKQATASFTAPGSYALVVTVRDAQGLTATSRVDVVVEQTLTALVIAPASAIVRPGQLLDFAAAGRDQFGGSVAVTSAWAVSGGGTISASGRFTAGASPGGPFVVTATSGTISGTATVTIDVAGDLPPIVAYEGPEGATGAAVVLRASASDDVGVIEVVFELDGSEVARVTTSPWEAPVSGLTAGAHQVRVTAKDTVGQTTTVEGSFEVVLDAPTAGGMEPVTGSCGCSGTGLEPLLGLALGLLLRRRRVRSRLR